MRFGRDAARNCAEAIVVAGGALLYLCLAHPSFASAMTAKEKEIEYRGRKLTLRQFANGWRVEIVTPARAAHSNIDVSQIGRSNRPREKDRERGPLRPGPARLTGTGGWFTHHPVLAPLAAPHRPHRASALPARHALRPQGRRLVEGCDYGNGRCAKALLFGQHLALQKEGV